MMINAIVLINDGVVLKISSGHLSYYFCLLSVNLLGSGGVVARINYVFELNLRKFFFILYTLK